MNDRKVLPGFLLFASLLSAQTPAAKSQRQLPAFMGPCANLVCEIENDWSRNNVMIYGLAGAMPEDQFSYKPTPSQQSFGERVLHVAQVNLMLLQALGAKTPAPAIDTNATSKAASMAALQRVGEYGLAVIKELGEQGLVARIDSPSHGILHGSPVEPPESPVLPDDALAGHLRAVGCVHTVERPHSTSQPSALTWKVSRNRGRGGQRNSDEDKAGAFPVAYGRIHGTSTGGRRVAFQAFFGRDLCSRSSFNARPSSVLITA